MSPQQKFAWFVAVGGLIAALFNVASEIPIPTKAGAIHIHSGGDPASLIATEQLHLATNYGLYADLRELAPGATLILPEEPLLDPYVISGLALVDVEMALYDPAAPWLSNELQGASASGLVEVSVDGGFEDRPYVIRPFGESTPVLRLVTAGDTLVILDDATYRRAVAP